MNDISGSWLNLSKTKILCLSDYKPIIYRDYFAEEVNNYVEFFFTNNSREKITMANQMRIFEKIKQTACWI